MRKAERIKIGLMIGIVVMLMFGCAHKNGKPYTALDYAKVSLNQLNGSFQVAVALVPEMKAFPDPKVQAAYPQVLGILAKAGDALLLLTDAVRLWEVSGVRPTDIGDLKANAQRLVDDATNLLIELGVIK